MRKKTKRSWVYLMKNFLTLTRNKRKKPKPDKADQWKSDLIDSMKNFLTQTRDKREKSNNWFNGNNFILFIDRIQAI